MVIVPRPRKVSRSAPDETPELVRLTDPRAIRALAHPARLAVLDALNDVDKTLTATQAAELTGLSPSAMSYHLRALAKWGIVRVADTAEHADGRERRWRRGGAGLFMESLPPGTESATAIIAARSLDRTRALTLRFLERSARESEFWRDNATISQADVWLTEAEAAELNQKILEITDAFRRERRTSRTHPDDSRLVHASFVILPGDDAVPGDEVSSTDEVASTD
jgi:DNA-binding transcriptional ArsR family regulator